MRTTPKPLLRQFGATLTEGIVVMMISTLFLSVLPGFHLTYVKIWQRESAELGALHRANFALRRMQDDVRNARRVVVSTDGTALTLVQPLRAYDSTLDKDVNQVDDEGNLQDGDLIQYYLVQTASGHVGATMYRRVVHPSGVIEPERIVAVHLHPNLNPLDVSSGATRPLFRYDSSLRAVTVVVTAAEPRPSSGTFAPATLDLECRRDHGTLTRVMTEDHPDGVIQCSQCGDQVKPTGEIVAYQTQLALRNE